MTHAAALHGEAGVADTHNDLLMSVAARPVGLWGRFFRERWLPQLRDGGVTVQVLPVFVDDPYRPEGALRQTLRMLECAHRIAEQNADDVALCRDGEEVDAAVAAGRIALVLALESAPGVDADVELLQTLHRLGVRVASLAHVGRTPLADGSGEDATGSRLTRGGVEAVWLMEEIGILFDVSHLGRAGVDHVLEIATRPVIATHSAARAVRDIHRNLPDEHLKSIADGGGVICVPVLGIFLNDGPEPTLDHLVDHFEHVASVAGVEHVGLGPDFIREVYDDLTPPWCAGLPGASGLGPMTWVPELDGPAGLPLVTEALLRRGWGEVDVRAVLSGNVRRLFRAELGRPGNAR